ncbi:hypothetical protein GCM10010145_48120 [Streptomyces ruber]|uniref:Uncharacterized protein n=2 Tax=Streptomyces TaxID=1883 RepID=A0A918BIY8_9ACTN|nr:hypothetical protein GCM10010145_48120 [Streptomyces ruber]
MVAGDGEDVAELPVLQRGPQVRVAPVDLVAGHPGHEDTGVQGAPGSTSPMATPTRSATEWRPIMRAASAGSVAKRTVSGIPAAWQRAVSWAQERGTYSSRSIAAWPRGVEQAR